ncbi:hypothetical protein P5673_024826 [Acropora cervicornis]|uniref:Uncharacterized protein n=1 Tax=Acropora cervicornis TaxID=6130 RepID=A0AAD9Q334_ACRCE|nr:hypothetical protein P5673_024826 [Acropora cervicornis]
MNKALISILEVTHLPVLSTTRMFLCDNKIAVCARQRSLPLSAIQKFTLYSAIMPLNQTQPKLDGAMGKGLPFANALEELQALLVALQ